MERTKRQLSKYRDMEWKCERAKEVIKECNEAMTRLQGFSDSPIVQGGENRREEFLASCIDRKQGAEEAIAFMKWMNDALDRLDDEEKQILYLYYIDKEGIRAVTRMLRCSKQTAYRRANKALNRLDSLLF